VPRAPAAPARRLEPHRLPRQLTSEQLVPLGMALVGVVAGYLVVFKGMSWTNVHPGYAVTATLVALAGVFLLERRVLIQTQSASLRFAGFGVLAPLLYYFLKTGALIPLLVLQGMTTYRLGVGSVAPPAIAATALTGLLFGPYGGLIACIGHVWPGIAVLGYFRRGDG
jgi:hypothetical protein